MQTANNNTPRNNIFSNFPTFGLFDFNSNAKSIDHNEDYNNISYEQSKKDFIQKYGIELQMPANYIFAAHIYKPDPNYIISACCQIFPTDVDVYDYNKLLTGEDSLATDFIEQQQQISGKLTLKVYSNESGKYQQKNVRLCDSKYFNKACFSNDNSRLALFRKLEEKSQVTLNLNTSSRDEKFMIDIFDCSKVDFFLNDETLTPEDQCHVASIQDPALGTMSKRDNIFISFSQNGKYLYLIFGRRRLAIYDASKKHSTIKKHLILINLPIQYQEIVEISLDEKNIGNSILAVKRSDFRNIEIVRLNLLQEIDEKIQQFCKGQLSNQEFTQLQQQHLLASIKVASYDFQQINMKFSQDNSKCIYCDQDQNLIIEFSSQKSANKVKQINHLLGKQCRSLQSYEDSDFMIATADPQDNEISIRHSSNPNKKVKFYIRYSEGPVVLRDIYYSGNTQNVLLTRDDEEFIVYKFEDFNNRPKFWQRIYESSNYLFEWPYICYVNGKNQVMVQNCFQPQKSIIVSLQDIKENFFISNIFVSEAYNLYIMIETENKYMIYERDLDPCVDVFLQTIQDTTLMEKLQQSTLFKRKMTLMQTERPVAVINKSNLNRKPIFKFYVRSSTQKELIQTDAESIILFFCDFKLYQIVKGEIQLVDNGYRYKMVHSNLLAYQTVDENNKKSNQIKLLKLNISDCTILTLYKETNHKLEDFLIQHDMLLVLIKSNQTNLYALKVYKIAKGKTPKLLGQVQINDEQLANNLQTVDQFQNNMIPSGNDVLILSKEKKNYELKKYVNVIPIDKEEGDQLLFNSPLMSFLYRKMVYFKSNKSKLKPKTGIVMPYLNDNFSIFNRREQVSQYSQFYEYQNIRDAKHETDILVFIPFTQQLLRYNLQCQLLQSYKLNQIFKDYGEQTLAVSQNGRLFLQRSEENSFDNVVSIVQFQVKSTMDDISVVHKKNISGRSSKVQASPNVESVCNTVTQSMHSYKHSTPKAIEALLNKRKKGVQSQLDVTCEEKINLFNVEFADIQYQKQKLFSVAELIDFYQKNGCEIIYKLNDNSDLVIAFLYLKKQNNSTFSEIKDIILIKKIDNIRYAYKVKIDQEIIVETKPQQPKKLILTKNLSDLSVQLLDGYYPLDDKFQSQCYIESSQFNNLQNCIDFTITNDKLIIWSKRKFYVGNIDYIKHNDCVHLTESPFKIKEKDEAFIQSITSHGLTEKYLSSTEKNPKADNYYVYIKINVENKYAFFLKYNIYKNKEYGAFDCNLQSQVFFDHDQDGYILDEDCIVDIDQGVPLYFYKTGMKDINRKYIIGNSIDRGNRFCSENIHFMVRNRFYLPYSYFVFIMKDNTTSRIADSKSYDINSYYYYNGQTQLHQIANSYHDLEYILQRYEHTNPKLKNMLLLKNRDNQNVLQLALANENQRCVNLILQHLSNLSMNNIHQLKDSFVDLLEYNAFQDYLELCFYQTEQMKKKVVFQRKQKSLSDQSFISSHNQSFLDQEFYNKFEDKKNITKPVIIRSIDAGWLLKDQNGIDFMLQLSKSENMNYFAIDTVRILVKYQWQKIKPMIIAYLFIPFLLNMIIYSVYSVYIFELVRGENQKENNKYATINTIFQYTILTFTVYTFFVEIQQIKFHQREYVRSFWNVLDLITVVMAPLTIIMDMTYLEDYQIRPFMAICNLTFFMRFFYFLRIFDNTAHLIRTIVEITVDIFDFLFVFYLGIIGFGLSFYILSNNNNPIRQEKDDDNKFITSFANSFMYSYRMSLGDFQLDTFDNAQDSYLIWVLFVICSMTTTIILLNMLVAIMGEAFNRVNENSENSRVREHLQLLVENDFLLSDRKKFFKNVKYLIEVKDETQTSSSDPIVELIQNLGTKIKQKENEMKHQYEEMKNLFRNHQTEQAQNMTSLKNDIQNLHKMIEEKFANQVQNEKPPKAQSLQEKLEESLAQQLNLKELMQF